MDRLNSRTFKPGLAGQGNILEYALMVFFIVIIIFILILFLTGFQIFQFDSELQRQTLDRALYLSKQAMSSQFFTTKYAMFDGAKLAASTGMCREFENSFGSEWFFQVSILGRGEKTPCTELNYPDCSQWDICVKNSRNIYYTFPVNIYNKAKDIVDIGTLRVGVYT